MELYNEKNEVVEGALTKEEIDEKLDEARDEAKEAVITEAEEDKKVLQEEIDTLQDSVKEKEDEIEKVGDKDFNFGRLRKQKDALEKQITEMKTEMEGKINEVREGISNNRIDEEISRIAGGNKEVADKVRYHLNNFKLDEETDTQKKEENFKSRLNNAFILATGGKPTSSLSGEVVSSGGGYVPQAGGGGKLSEEGKEAAKSLGLTKEDIKSEK